MSERSSHKLWVTIAVAAGMGLTVSSGFDPQKGTEAKASAKIGKGCAADCPACYDGVLRPDSTPWVDAVEEQLDFIGVGIYCREAAGESPTTEEAKCEDAVARVSRSSWA